MGSGTGGCALRNPPYIIRPSGPAQPHSSSGEDSMQVSRRDFLQLTASAGAGTAIGGLVGLGVTLAPATARAQELRIKDAKTTPRDRKSTRLNSSHSQISYAVFCLKKKKIPREHRAGASVDCG